MAFLVADISKNNDNAVVVCRKRLFIRPPIRSNWTRSAPGNHSQPSQIRGDLRIFAVCPRSGRILDGLACLFRGFGQSSVVGITPSGFRGWSDPLRSVGRPSVDLEATPPGAARLAGSVASKSTPGGRQAPDPLSVSVLQIRPRDGSVALRDGFVAHGTAPLRTLAPFRSTGRPESLYETHL